jgi:hypothetical protein
MAVGRISGPLLKDNLLRNGNNLAFETNLLYLDVVNSRIGVNTTAPAYDLDVVGTTRSTNLYVNNSTTLGTITFSGNTISSTSNTINITAQGTNASVYSGTLQAGNLQLSGSTISALGTNTNINVTASGTGIVRINSNTLVNGDLHATGTITADGNITLGNATTDTVAFTGEVNSDIVPSASNTYNLGSSLLQWNNIYVNTANITNITITNLIASDVRTSSIDITNNTISALSPNTDINLTTSGSGGIVLGNFRFSNNTITNIASGGVSTFVEDATGYVKMAGTYGVVIPNGTTTDRPLTAELGMLRFNTQQILVEIFDGSGWTSAAGSAAGVTAAAATDISILQALIFGG